MKIRDNVRDYLWWIPLGAILFVLWPLIAAGRALAATTAVCVFSVIISEKWDRRFDRRFWLLLGVMALAHVVALAVIPFGEPRAGLAAVPFGFVDLLAMMAILHWAEKRFPSPPEQSRERH
jgi:O-antigen/teichoic acid export membrane protein